MSWRSELRRYAGACRAMGMIGIDAQLMTEDISLAEARKIVSSIFCFIAGYQMAAVKATNSQQISNEIQEFLMMSHDIANKLEIENKAFLKLMER